MFGGLAGLAAKAQSIASSGPVLGKSAGSSVLISTPSDASTRSFLMQFLFLNSHCFQPGSDGCRFSPWKRLKGKRQAWQCSCLTAVSWSLTKNLHFDVEKHCPPHPAQILCQQSMPSCTVLLTSTLFTHIRLSQAFLRTHDSSYQLLEIWIGKTGTKLWLRPNACGLQWFVLRFGHSAIFLTTILQE